VPDDDFRQQFAKLIRELLDEQRAEGESVKQLLTAHLGPGAGELPVLTEELDGWELPNLQLALETAFGEPGHSARIVGLAGGAMHYHGLSLGDLISGAGWEPALAAPQYVNVPVGPGRSLACLAFALVLVTSPQGPVVLFVKREHNPMGQAQLAVEAVATVDGHAARFLAELRRLMDERDVYRGQVLTVKTNPHGGAQIVFVERPRMHADELVLPAGVLEAVERHVVAPTRHRDALRQAGRHLSRGVLLWGPPGTGKTHTVRYLTSLMHDATVVILSGGSLGMVGAFAGLAKRLAPSLVVLEDVDLVAQERTYGPWGSSPVLFELMNEMDGLGDDADVAFVLTTNRPDALEPALAARPGRVDLAVELPLPDDAGRHRLLELYARGLDLRLDDPANIVARTAGVTAAFVKELLRKAALAAAEEGRAAVTQADVSAALDELLAETSALTRTLLGTPGPDGGAAPDPHAWLGGLVNPE
jgi:cell division protease FtsH